MIKEGGKSANPAFSWCGPSLVFLKLVILAPHKPIDCKCTFSEHKVRDSSHDTWMSFIPVRFSSQNKVLSVFTWPNLTGSAKDDLVLVVSDPDQNKNDTSFLAPIAPDYKIWGFHLGTRFVFSLYDTKMKCNFWTRISFELKTEMNSFQNTLSENEISP